MVGAVRAGIMMYAAEQKAAGKTQIYPLVLDIAPENYAASASNLFFSVVLDRGGVPVDWFKDKDGKYIGPAGGVYEYNPSNGKFEKR